MKLSRDAWAGLVVLAASLFLFWLTLELKESPLVPIGPGFYPRIVLGVTAVLALALVVSGLFSKQAAHEPAQRANYGAVALQFAMFGLYAVAMPWVGFRVATFVYVAAANALMAPPRKPAHWTRVAVLALVTALATHYVFEQHLSVLLPRGRWTGW